MDRIGVRELRQQASRYLRRVASGETIEITDRGRPVARLVPAGGGSPLERLEESGRLRPAEGSPLALGPPLPPARGRLLPSEVLRRLREAER